MAFVKMCGIQSFEEASAALACGATALGFHCASSARSSASPSRAGCSATLM